MLNTERKSDYISAIEEKLRARVIGQDRAVSHALRILEYISSGFNAPGRPLANVLLLGPSGVGKNRLVEAISEALYGTADGVVKVDCAEYQHSHEISKLLGSPAGYLGHRETPALLSQDRLEKAHTEKTKISLVLFDEVEKAHLSLWQLLLGVLDKGILTLGDTRVTNFHRSIIFFTSNLGAREIQRLRTGGIGFQQRLYDLDDKIYRSAKSAAHREYGREFMNRIDKILVFRELQEESLRRIIDIELDILQKQIENTLKPFVLKVSDDVKNLILREGSDNTSGARNIKRCIDRFLRFPLSRLVSSEQVGLADSVVAHMTDGEVVFDLEENVLAECASGE